MPYSSVVSKSKFKIALFIALLFYISGAIGILFTPYKQWFISATPFLLLLMAALLIITHPEKNSSFFIFLLLVFVAGMASEMLGVNTGLLFGNYSYGIILGKKINGVPLIIGVNWFIIIYCAGTITSKIENWILNKMSDEMQISTALQFFSFIIDGALLITFFDWVMEPVAQRLGFWKWIPNEQIPFYNYMCWFFISALLLIAFRQMKVYKHNPFAVHLFIIQLLFFLVLRTFL